MMMSSPVLLRRGTAVVALALLGAVPLAAQPARTPLTIERITTGRSLIGIAPVAPSWSPTSRQLAFLWNDAGLPGRTIWVVQHDGSGLRRLLDASSTAPVSEMTWLPRGDSLLFMQSGNIHVVAASGGTPRALTSDGGDKSDLSLSPDGSTLAWLSNGDLFAMPRAGGTVRQLTRVAVAPIGSVPLGTYFRRDVEIGSATWGSDAPPYAWSPDSRTIAVQYVDRRNVPTLRIPYYGDTAPVLNQLRRSAPGQVNEVRRVGLVDVATASLAFVPLPDSSITRTVTLDYASTGTLLIDRETDDAIDRTVFVVAPGSRDARRIWHDHRDTRIYNDVASAWDSDGRHILLTGDLEDRYRVYRISPADTTPRALTPATSDIGGAAIANAATKSIFWVSNAPRPSERHLWQMRADGSRMRQITSMAGTHVPFIAPDGRTVALLTSNDTTPPELYLLTVAPGATERRITRSQAPDFAATRWVQPEYVTVPSRTATPPIHLRVIYPPGMDRTKKYPVLLGPVYSNTVRNRWAGTYATLQQYLAIEKGYIVVQVDVRGSTGYGRDFREKFLMDWGGEDLEDLASAMDYLKTLPFVAADRFGIWGSSYGGTLTVYSLLRKPGLFQAGVAGAPATDPFYFGSDDVAIARRPQTHPETFKRGALQYAGNLRDHLLIIHGMQDDVVPFATSVALAEEFMRLGKNFDFAFAPAATHGWTQRPYYARYLLTRLVDHFDRYLGPGGR